MNNASRPIDLLQEELQRWEKNNQPELVLTFIRAIIIGILGLFLHKKNFVTPETSGSTVIIAACIMCAIVIICSHFLFQAILPRRIKELRKQTGAKEGAIY